MTTLSIGESVLLRLPDGRLISGHISRTFDFVADEVEHPAHTD